MQWVDNGDTVQDKSRDVRCISGDHQLLSAKQISWQLKYFPLPICRLGGWGALLASGAAAWGVRHSINKRRGTSWTRPTLDSFSVFAVNKTVGGIPDWPFRSGLNASLGIA